MTTQSYLQIQNNVVTNIIEWDGDTQTWTPPEDAIMKVKDTTPVLVWKLNDDKTDHELTQIFGGGGIGFTTYTWDGSVLLTNQPKPTLNDRE